MKVLLIEDDQALTDILKLFFEFHGGEHELICANTVTEALQYLQQGCPDLILLDLILQDSICYPVLDRMIDANCRTLVISASPQKAEIVSKKYKLDMLSKPFELEQLEKYLH